MSRVSKAAKLPKGTRGATMVEYALLIVAIMVSAATAYRTLGTTVMAKATESSAMLGQ